MTKRGFADVSGHHIEQQRSKRKEDEHSMYADEGMEHSEANVKKNGRTSSLNETHAEADFAGKSDEAFVIGSFSPHKEYHSIDSEPNKEDDTYADKSTSSERKIMSSTTSLYSVTNVFPTSNLPQPNKMLLSQVHGCTAYNRASEPADAATINEHLPSDIFPIEKVQLSENFDSVHQNSSRSEDFENHVDLKSIISKQFSTSMERRKDNLPEYGSEGNVCRVSSSVDAAICQSNSTENFAVTESTCDVLSLKNAINCEKASLPYLTERPSIQANVAEKDMNLREDPSNVVSLGIHGDLVTQGKENAGSFSRSCTSKDNPDSKRRKKEARELVPVLPERSLTCRNRKKLLILDLNGLLCDIVNDYYAYGGERRIGGKPIFKRPFCDDFLKFCFKNFDIGIWSSRRKYNVDSVLDYLMGEFKHKLLFCWDQSKCTYTGARTLVNHHKPLVLKELKKLWDKEESDLPWQKGEFSPSNTLLLDDSPYKALFNPMHTAIFPYPYQHTDEGDKSLGPGGDIRVYLECLLVTDDVQRYVEEHPFGQPAITSSDQHWNFYSDIIKRHAPSSS